MGAVSKIEAQEVAASNIITPQDMIQQAIQSGSGVEVMERLLALQERHDAFQARKAFDDAMADMRSDMPTIIKGQSADFGKGKTAYKFEDLSAVTEALSPIMAKVGLSFRWRTQSQQHGVAVTCIISHREGHSEETTLFAGLDTSGSKNAIQALGSAVTYLQRYTLKAAVGVAAAKDDDGQEVSRQAEREPEQRQPVDNSRAILAGFDSEIQAAGNSAILQAIWKRIEASTLSDDQVGELSAIINVRLAALKAKATATKPQSDDPFGFDKMDRDIPYGSNGNRDMDEDVQSLMDRDRE